MEKVIRFNIYSDTMITPLVLTWATYAKVVSKTELDIPKTIAIFIVIPIVVGLISFIIQRYSQKKKFGNYVDQLRYNLQSLENNSEKM